jgi:ubiquinone/menaquinone biosynthesis C-methylase UbiE
VYPDQTKNPLNATRPGLGSKTPQPDDGDADQRTREALRVALAQPRFPRAATYDPLWVMANEMGPNVLWLTEAVCQQMTLSPGMRVLDMGCGRGLSSVFLAREYGVRVWANDLWVKPEAIWQRAREAGVEDQICPIHAEARGLPYAEEFFDAIVCIDSYAYYGTDDLYLPYFARFVRPGGQIGLVVAGLTEELEGAPPEHLTRPQQNGVVFWDPSESACFHSTAWWRRHLEQSGLVDVELAQDLEDACGLWLQWERARDGGGFSGFPSDAETLERDGGRTIAFPLLVVRRLQDAKIRPHSLQFRLP